MDLVRVLACAILMILPASGGAWADDGADDGGGRVELEYELDPYYTGIDLYVSLTDKPVPDVGEKPEFEIYRDLFLHSYVPRYAVMEVSLNPLPVLGAIVRDRAPDFYERAEVSPNLNLVKALTAGFEEPYAVSIFFGDVVKFNLPGGGKRVGNRGYMGYFLSYGNQHIKDNMLIKDSWYEIEWKIKGDRVYPTSNLRWSFRVGAKLHDNREIADIYYVSLRRSMLNFLSSALSVLQNSGFEYTCQIDTRTLSAMGQSLVLEKKWPVTEMRKAVTLSVGFVWDAANKYSGALKDTNAHDNFQFIVRPSVEF